MVVSQKILAHADQRYALLEREPRARVGIHLLMAIDHLLLTEPLHDPFAAEPAAADKAQIARRVDGRERHHHRLYTLLPQRFDGTAHRLDERRQLRARPVVERRILRDSGPVIVAVIAAVGHESIARVHTAGHVVLHELQPFCRRRAHLRAVRNRHALARVPVHDLRQVKMISKALIRHGCLQ